MPLDNHALQITWWPCETMFFYSVYHREPSYSTASLSWEISYNIKYTISVALDNHSLKVASWFWGTMIYYLVCKMGDQVIRWSWVTICDLLFSVQYIYLVILGNHDFKHDPGEPWYLPARWPWVIVILLLSIHILCYQSQWPWVTMIYYSGHNIWWPMTNPIKLLLFST